jgi:Type IV pilus assembly protein PilM
MNRPEFNHAADLFIDIGQSSFRAVLGDDAFAFTLERGENGRLTDHCRERLTASLRGFLSQKGRASGRNAFCALGARGVSLRRLSLPASPEDELQRVLRLQIESEFPLSPDDLAWGSRPVGPPRASVGGGAARQEMLVVAVKKETLEEFASILAACGAVPFFTLAALARAELHPPPAGAGAVLDIGRTHSELMTFDHGVPASIRILAWGGETITGSIQEEMAVSHDEAERLKLEQGPPLQSALESALAPLARSLKPAALGGQLYLTGKSARDPRLAPMLAGLLGGAVACKSLEPATATETSTAIAGLIKATGRNGASPPLLLQSGGGQPVFKPARPAIWKWAAAAAGLALGTLLFPYAEAILCQSSLEKKLAALEADRGRLAAIDQELDFLKYLKQNQFPCLDAVYLLARSAPDDMHLESLSLGRHQEISLRLNLGDTQQVTDFRSKLIESGWFANVIVEEQTPTPDRRMDVRMTAALKPAELRKPITKEPPGKKKDRSGDEPGFRTPPPQHPMKMPPSQPKALPGNAPPVPQPDEPDEPDSDAPAPIQGHSYIIRKPGP